MARTKQHYLENPSKLTAALSGTLHTLATLQPYLVQLCNPTSFHPSHWPEFLAELRFVCGTQANFPPALNIQTRLQTYTVYELLDHLLLFLSLSHQSLTSQKGALLIPAQLSTLKTRSLSGFLLAYVKAFYLRHEHVPLCTA